MVAGTEQKNSTSLFLLWMSNASTELTALEMDCYQSDGITHRISIPAYAIEQQ
jgi:hypothetical protein